jgi:hypothetical protein
MRILGIRNRRLDDLIGKLFEGIRETHPERMADHSDALWRKSLLNGVFERARERMEHITILDRAKGTAEVAALGKRNLPPYLVDIRNKTCSCSWKSSLFCCHLYALWLSYTPDELDAMGFANTVFHIRGDVRIFQPLPEATLLAHSNEAQAEGHDGPADVEEPSPSLPAEWVKQLYDALSVAREFPSVQHALATKLLHQEAWKFQEERHRVRITLHGTLATRGKRPRKEPKVSNALDTFEDFRSVQKSRKKTKAEKGETTIFQHVQVPLFVFHVFEDSQV